MVFVLQELEGRLISEITPSLGDLCSGWNCVLVTCQT